MGKDAMRTGKRSEREHGQKKDEQLVQHGREGVC